MIRRSSSCLSWPAGIRSVGLHAGIKAPGVLDLGVIVTDAPTVWAGTFTQNAAAAACVGWCRDAHEQMRAIVVNSGNANACTGSAGAATVRATAAAAAEMLGCSTREVLIASTGPIGMVLDPTPIVDSLPAALSGLSTDPEPFARAIQTTDTTTKIARYTDGCQVVGVAKGAAMCAPGMATMLAFIATDAIVDHHVLSETLRAAVDSTFNRLSIDACESTNDSVFCMATGQHAVDGSMLADGITSVCRDLAHAIALDAEGATKLVRIYVTGARDDAHALRLGRAVAASALWRSALHGADPNWGRVLAAMGSVDRTLHMDACRLAIGPEVVFDAGEPAGSLEAAGKIMSADEVSVHCVVGEGRGAAEILTSDLSEEYVSLNAEGTS